MFPRHLAHLAQPGSGYHPRLPNSYRYHPYSGESIAASNRASRSADPLYQQALLNRLYAFNYAQNQSQQNRPQPSSSYSSARQQQLHSAQSTEALVQQALLGGLRNLNSQTRPVSQLQPVSARPVVPQPQQSSNYAYASDRPTIQAPTQPKFANFPSQQTSQLSPLAPPRTISPSSVSKSPQSERNIAAPKPKAYTSRSQASLASLFPTEKKPTIAQSTLRTIDSNPILASAAAQAQAQDDKMPRRQYRLQDSGTPPVSVSVPLAQSYLQSKTIPARLENSSGLSQRQVPPPQSQTRNSSQVVEKEVKKDAKRKTTKPLRPVSPATMIALTEPILMDWCFDDEAIRRLAKVAGCE